MKATTSVVVLMSMVSVAMSVAGCKVLATDIPTGSIVAVGPYVGSWTGGEGATVTVIDKGNDIAGITLVDNGDEFVAEGRAVENSGVTTVLVTTDEWDHVGFFKARLSGDNLEIWTPVAQVVVDAIQADALEGVIVESPPDESALLSGTIVGAAPSDFAGFLAATPGLYDVEPNFVLSRESNVALGGSEHGRTEQPQATAARAVSARRSGAALGVGLAVAAATLAVVFAGVAGGWWRRHWRM